jgi:hypothetical protein
MLLSLRFLDMQLFKDLTRGEEQAFRLWAQENYQPFEPISTLWHPIVQEECTRINHRAQTFG